MKKPYTGQHTMAWLAGASIVLYMVLALFISGLSLQLISTSLILGVSVMVTYIWGPAAFFAIKRKAIGKNQLAIAIFTLSTVFIMSRLYNVAYVIFNRPWWWPNESILGFFGYLFAMALVLFVSAPANVDAPEPYYYRRLVEAVVLGAVTVGISYWVQVFELIN